jgi:uncharacterized protein (TIGR02118 family)
VAGFVRLHRASNGAPEEVALTVKLVALWGTPSDVEGFEKDYGAIHLHLVAAIPGLKGAVASKALNGPYYRMAELLFDDAESMGSALGSPEAEKLLADAGRLQEAFGATLDVLTVEELAQI